MSDAMPIVRFPSRPEWGRGRMVEERDGKRYYDFEDGERHVLLELGWTKLERVDLPDNERAAIERKLKGIAQRKEAVAKKTRKRSVVRKPAPSFADQITYFEAKFPGGFEGEKYVEDERAPANLRGPKGYKERVIQMAKKVLAKDELAKHKAAGDLPGIVESARKVMQSAFTLMHPQTDVIPFAHMAPEHHEAYVDALEDLLHGDGEYGTRFDRHVEVLARSKVSWPLATFLPAVFNPSEHLFVKPQPIEEQASILGLNVGFDPEPSSEGYKRMRAVGEEVRRRLIEGGHTPRDFLDVYTFIWLTRTAPAASDRS